ncbi:MAG: hypothetical protein K6V73_10910 [Firmicutes bacterium]|nr:hypothetical protein [Bacillota bacterium]
MSRKGMAPSTNELQMSQLQWLQLHAKTVAALQESADLIHRLGVEAQLSPVSNNWRLRAASAWVRLLSIHDQLLVSIDGLVAGALAKALAEAGVVDERQRGFKAMAHAAAQAVVESIRVSEDGEQ